MKKQIIFLGTFSLLVALLVACGNTTLPAGDTGPTEVATEVPAEATPEDVPEEVTTPTAGAGAVPTVEERVIGYVAAETGAAPESIAIVEQEAVDWPSSALGCPQPGTAYLDVIVPGYQMQVDVSGEVLAVHTDLEGNNIIICETGGDTGGQSGGNMDPVETRVVEFVATEMGTTPDAIRITNREERDWRNSALECPAPGTGYLDVITPGFQFMVEAKGETLDVRTNEDASNIVICRLRQGGNSGEGSDGALGALTGQTGAVARQALSFLAGGETGIEESAFTLVNAEEVVWPDSGLGCPQPDTMYMQVLTDGFQFTFEANGETFYVHTNADGSVLVVCDNPQAPAPSMDQ
ncbi:MAG: hypothetical protein ACRDIB_00040 [Ardenticatenaceae bacterium]